MNLYCLAPPAAGHDVEQSDGAIPRRVDHGPRRELRALTGALCSRPCPGREHHFAPLCASPLLLTPVAAADNQDVSAPIFDEADLLERLGDDAELVAEVLTVFLDDAPVRIEAINAALAQCDAAELRAAAHALKGAAGSIAAVRLYEAAQALEQGSHGGQLDAAAVALVVSETDTLTSTLRARAAA